MQISRSLASLLQITSIFYFFFAPKGEKPSGPGTSGPWTCGGVWAQPARARADPPPTRPHRAREVAAVSGALRSPLRGLLAGRIPTRPGHFPLLCRNAVRLKKDEGRRRGETASTAHLSASARSMDAEPDALRDSRQFLPPLPRVPRLRAAHWLLLKLCPTPSGWGGNRVSHLLLADWWYEKSGP